MRINLAWDEPDQEPNCERCGNPESWCGCKPLVECPQCHEEQEDLTGWGLLYCVECGYCSVKAHDGYCQACEEEKGHAA